MDKKNIFLEKIKSGHRDLEIASNNKFSNLEFLANSVFDFTTDDSDFSEEMGKRAVEVCQCIQDGKTYEYIEDTESYRWFLILLNTPFFQNKIEYGTSIRGSWWNYYIDYENYYLDIKIKDHQDEWKSFVEAIIQYSKQ